jgi:hypothetical protein
MGKAVALTRAGAAWARIRPRAGPLRGRFGLGSACGLRAGAGSGFLCCERRVTVEPESTDVGGGRDRANCLFLPGPASRVPGAQRQSHPQGGHVLKGVQDMAGALTGAFRSLGDAVGLFAVRAVAQCPEGHLRDMADVRKGALGVLNVLKGTFETSPLSRRAPSCPPKHTSGHGRCLEVCFRTQAGPLPRKRNTRPSVDPGSVLANPAFRGIAGVLATRLSRHAGLPSPTRPARAQSSGVSAAPAP